MDNLNKWLMLIANIGVLIGIVFLALEINQNNELMAAQDRFNRYTVGTTPAITVSQGADLNKIITDLRMNGMDSLAPEERTAAEMFTQVVLDGWEWTFKEIPSDEIPTQRWGTNFRWAHFHDQWDGLKANYRPDFVEFIENEVRIDFEFNNRNVR